MDIISNAKLKRNFLFCLLSNIEIDLRKNIVDNDKIEKNSSILEKLKNRYKDDNNNETNDIMFLINYADLGDYIQILNSNCLKFINSKMVKKLTDEIEKIVPTRNRIMHIRPLEPNDDKLIIDFVNKMNKFSDIINFSNTISEYNKIKEDPDYLLSVVPNIIIKEKQKIKHNLPMVDYDDTGFIGRNKDKDELKKKITGPYPVISVIGVGGIGKTSLVLSCLYEMLDEEAIFNTIIWITLKTKGLYNGDFKEIKDVILNLDENFKKINYDFQNDNISNINDILSYMSNNKTLLVIDNLETLSNDKTIIKLFEEIPNGSKILITSRIGFGNYEQSFKLEALNNKESLDYFRKLAKVYKVKSLIKQTDNSLEKYLEKLNNNPLAIKWFIINVGKGMVPSEILNNHISDLTDFCLSNIYDKLSEDAKYILRIILIKTNKCGLAELLYLCELSHDRCLNSINELFTSNFLVQNDDFSYSILDFAVNYIQNKKGIFNYEIDSNIQTKINKLNGSLENLKNNIHLVNEYHPLSLFPKTNDERIATLYMLKAIECSKNKNYSEVDEFISLAQNATFSFSDIYKIAGYIYSKYDSIKSENFYNIAINRAENKAPVYYFFAGSLINNQKYEMAEEVIKKAIELEPDNSLIKLRYARLEKMQNKFNISLRMLSDIDNNSFNEYESKMEVKYIFEMIDTRIRYAESLLENDKELSFSNILETLKFLSHCKTSLFDFTIYNSLFKLCHIYIRLLSNSNFDTKEFIDFIFHYHSYILAAKNGHKKEHLFESDLDCLCQRLSDDESKKINDIFNYNGSIKDINYGYICSLKKERGYGFITPSTYSYQTIFFHCSQFKGDFRKLNAYDKVSFEMFISSQKVNAVNVRLYKYDKSTDDN